jgi:hypothetical protein
VDVPAVLAASARLGLLRRARQWSSSDQDPQAPTV